MAIFGCFFVNSVHYLRFWVDHGFCPYWHAGSGAFAAKNWPKAKNRPRLDIRQCFTGESIGKTVYFYQKLQVLGSKLTKFRNLKSILLSRCFICCVSVSWSIQLSFPIHIWWLGDDRWLLSPTNLICPEFGHSAPVWRSMQGARSRGEFETLPRSQKSNFRRTNVDEWAERQNGGRAMNSRHFSYDYGFGATQKWSEMWLIIHLILFCRELFVFLGSNWTKTRFFGRMWTNVSWMGNEWDWNPKNGTASKGMVVAEISSSGEMTPVRSMLVPQFE